MAGPDRVGRLTMLQARIDAALERLGVAPDARLGLAVSGGADSMALLELASRRPDVVAFHVDHGLHPSSPEAAALVADRCRGLGVPMFTERVAVPTRGSLEAQARRVRYDALARLADRTGATHVATAHTLDDQAETVLSRVMRGGGVDGLRAVRPTAGRFVRPLLDIRRDDLRVWLERRGVTWFEDPTNTDERFERNWIRHRVLPLLRSRRPGVDQVLATLADAARADGDALDALAAAIPLEQDTAGVFIDGGVGDHPVALGRRVVRRAMRLMGVEPSQELVAQILETGHARLERVTVATMHDGLAFVADRPPDEPLVLPEEGAVPGHFWGVAVRVGAPKARAGWRFPRPDGRVMLRARRPGDRVRTPVGTRKVHDILIDAKVPRVLRDRVPVLATEHGACAVVGVTRSVDDAVVVEVDPVTAGWSTRMIWNRT